MAKTVVSPQDVFHASRPCRQARPRLTTYGKARPLGRPLVVRHPPPTKCVGAVKPPSVSQGLERPPLRASLVIA